MKQEVLLDLAKNNINPSWIDMHKTDYWTRERIIKSCCLIQDKIKETDVVLDIGAFQQFVKNLLPRCQYFPIDSYVYKNNLVVDLDHLESLPSASYVVCLETLEHLKDPGHTLGLIRDCLDPSGLAVISLPNESTIYHRLRGLFFGLMDGECFFSQGKHLHLPSLRQCRRFLLEHGLQIVHEKYYIFPTATGSRSLILRKLLHLIPCSFHQALANWYPSLFARGFIFLVQPK